MHLYIQTQLLSVYTTLICEISLMLNLKLRLADFRLKDINLCYLLCGNIKIKFSRTQVQDTRAYVTRTIYYNFRKYGHSLDSPATQNIVARVWVNEMSLRWRYQLHFLSAAQLH